MAKNEANRRRAGHAVAQRRFPRLGDCERCGRRAEHRHHKDGNTHNNDRTNVEFLCVECHMREHKLVVRPCRICGRETAGRQRRHGRCGACRAYFKINGVERPARLEGRVKGVSFDAQTQKWRIKFTRNGVTTDLGRHATRGEAIGVLRSYLDGLSAES